MEPEAAGGASPHPSRRGWFLTLHRWAVDPREALPRLGEHRSWVLRQHDAGNIVISGPTPDRALGIMVFRSTSQAEVEAILRSEPWIAAGERTVEIIPWDVHELLGVDLTGGG